MIVPVLCVEMCDELVSPGCTMIKGHYVRYRDFWAFMEFQMWRDRFSEATELSYLEPSSQLDALLNTTGPIKKDTRNRLNYEALANGLVVVAATKPTVDEAAYTQPTDSHLFQHRLEWPNVPLNNIMIVKEENTPAGAEVQPKKQQEGSEWNWNHYVVLLLKTNNAANRKELVQKMCDYFNNTVTEENGYRFPREFRVGEDRTSNPNPRPADAVFLNRMSLLS
jgi:hypothetical protein